MSILSHIHSFFALPHQSRTLGAFRGLVGPDFASLSVILLSIPAALPLPTGGLTHVFQLVVMLISLEIMRGLPTTVSTNKYQNVPLSFFSHPKVQSAVLKICEFFDRLAGHQAPQFFQQVRIRVITGGLIFVFSIGAFVAIPFSNLDTLPSLGVVCLGMSLLYKDWLFWVIGIVIGVIGTALNSAIIAKLIQIIYHYVITLFS